MSRTFEALIKDIEKNKQIAATSLDELDPRTYTTKLGHIKRAKENLKELSLQYRTEVSARAIFILTDGKQSESFIDVATGEDFGLFAVKAEALYEDIVSKISSRYYEDQPASPAVFDLLMSSFNDVCDEIGIIGYPAVLFDAKYKRRLKSKEDLINLTKEAFNDMVGSDLVGLYAIDKVAKEAINKGYNGKTIPIIIHTVDKELTKELEQSLKNITPNVFKVSTVKKHTQKTVEESLLKIREKLK